MKALVTGGTGFVGSHLLDALGRLGVDVRALARSPDKAAAMAREHVEWIAGPLDDEEAVGRAVRNVDVIFHLAGTIAARNEREYLAVNRDGTRRLLTAAEDTGARFVLVSSLAAAGPSSPDSPLRGDEPARPVTAYGRSKLAAEEAVRASRLPWTIVRPPAVYGPRDRELLRVFRAVKLGLAPLFGTGSQQVSLVFAPDLADALIAAGTSEDTVGRVYFASHPDVVTTAEMIRRLAEVGEHRIRMVRIPGPLARGLLHLTGAAARLAGRVTVLNADKANEFLAPAWTCDSTALERDTGWRAAHGLDDGLAATWAWYRRQGWV